MLDASTVELNELPYGLTRDHIRYAVSKTEEFFSIINTGLSDNACPKLHDIMSANGLSGMISDLLILYISNFCPGLAKNTKIGGYPDLIPRDSYQSDSILKGGMGIEIKSSKSGRGWQGHNAEEGWFLAAKYDVNIKVQITEIYLAQLNIEDWTYYGRKENSRRTPTASINKSGLKKLRENLIYHNGDKNGMA